MELIKELGRRIQKARKEKGLTQQELADLSHVYLKHVQGCARGISICLKMSKPPTICGSFTFRALRLPEKCC